jgi:uncharacterized protein YjgD (DUF1641 family)
MTTSDNTATVTPLDSATAMQRLGQGACDALTDEMIGRLSETISNGMTLLDQINRSGLDKAIPVLAQMAQNGDLERVAQMARLIGSAQDSLTDEMVGRLTEMVSGGMTLLDQVNRNGAARLINILTRLETVEAMLEGVQEAAHSVERNPPPAGLRGLWKMITDRDNHKVMHFFMAVGKELQQRCSKGC